MAVPLLNYTAAFRQAVSEELVDMTSERLGFTGLLMALDNYYGVENVRFRRPKDFSGSALQLDMLMATPVVQGVAAKTGSISAQAITRVKNFSTQAGEQIWSYYNCSETVMKSHIKILEKTPPALSNYLRTIAASAIDAWQRKHDDDIISTTVVTPSVGAAAETKIMTLMFPLQSGYADNEPTGAGTYTVYGIDLNNASNPDNTQIKAVNSGSVSAGFGVLSPTNLRTKLLLPLRHRGSDCDFGLCDSTIYDYMIATAESKFQIQQAEDLKYGGLYVKYCGIRFIPHPNLDHSNYSSRREVIVGRSKDWSYWMPDFSSVMSVIEDVDDSPSIMLMQGFAPTALICTAPRMQGRGFKVTTS